MAVMPLVDGPSFSQTDRTQKMLPRHGGNIGAQREDGEGEEKGEGEGGGGVSSYNVIRSMYIRKCLFLYGIYLWEREIRS